MNPLQEACRERPEAGGSSRPPEAAFRMDDLSGDPAAFRGDEEIDEARGILRSAEAAGREPRQEDLVELFGDPSRVGRSGVDRVDRGTALSELTANCSADSAAPGGTGYECDPSRMGSR